jgi:di/tricarboxylate transporter
MLLTLLLRCLLRPATLVAVGVNHRLLRRGGPEIVSVEGGTRYMGTITIVIHALQFTRNLLKMLPQDHVFLFPCGMAGRLATPPATPLL